MKFPSFSIPCAILAAGLLLSIDSQALTPTANNTLGNLVVNGSFNYTTAGTNTPDSWTNIGTSAGGNGNVTGSGTPTNVTASTNFDGGSNFNVYRGPGDALPDGTQGLSQSITGLISGHQYVLTFESAASSYYNDPGTYRWAVSLGGSALQYGSTLSPGITDNRVCPGNNATCTGAGGSVSSSWTASTLNFTAGSASSILKFAAYMPPTNEPTTEQIFLDGIVLKDVTPVPEPASAALLLAGLASIGFRAKRRKLQ